MKPCYSNIGLDQPFFVIAGPCVIESEQLQMDTAGRLKNITASLGINFIFKSSFDKANRSSGSTFRGPCIDKGLEILAKVKRELLVPVLARAAVTVGVAGLFMETHPDPAKALSDGPNAVPLKHMKALLETLLELDRVTKKNGFLETRFSA